MEQAQEIHEITLDEAHGPQIGKLSLLEMQLAQGANLIADLADERRKVHAVGSLARSLPRIATLEPVLDLGPRKLVQHHLHHRELVQVGVEETGNDHGRGSEGHALWRVSMPQCKGRTAPLEHRL